ncbi:MAG: type II toxin-antitoxin system RelE/ParE family toxin [Chloroflexi bacterium]|nr:type II toxin-antitoxin system RelE/ParE family toxin [Chloroflexota bacterium]
MGWGTVELEPEVAEWLHSLSHEEFERVAFYLDLLEERGPLLDEPYTRQLRGKLRELRFYLGPDRQRVTYYIAPGRRIILLTVFRKTARRERSEIERAFAAMERCLAEEHTSHGEE